MTGYRPYGGGSGGGGGGSGTAAWGPDFGGADGDRFQVEAAVFMPAIGLNIPLTTDAAVTMPALAIDYSGNNLIQATAAINNMQLGINFANDPTVQCALGNGRLRLDFEANEPQVTGTITMPALALAGGTGVSGAVTGTAEGAPFHWDVETADGDAVTSLTINKPSGVVEDDLMVAFIGTKRVISPGTQNKTAPSGWTEVDQRNNGAIAPSIWWKVAGASEPSTYQWTFSGGSSDQATGEIHHVKGADTTTPVDVWAYDQVIASDLDPDPDAPSVSTTVVNTLVFAHLLHDHLALSQTHTPPGSHEEETDFQSSSTGDFLGSTTAWRVFSATGNTGAAGFNCTETVATLGSMYRVAIRPGTTVLA